MSERAPRRYTDGSVTFDGGIDSGVMPSEVDKNQVAFAVNVNFREGFISPRPGARRGRACSLPRAVSRAVVQDHDGQRADLHPTVDHQLGTDGPGARHRRRCS